MSNPQESQYVPQPQPGYAQPPPGYAQPPPGYAQPPPGYAQAPPGYAPPQQGYAQPQPGYAQAPQPQVVHYINGVPTTAPPGKSTVVEEEMYCGPITWIIGIFLLPCICFCPVDRRQRVTHV